MKSPVLSLKRALHHLGGFYKSQMLLAPRQPSESKLAPRQPPESKLLLCVTVL